MEKRSLSRPRIFYEGWGAYKKDEIEITSDIQRKIRGMVVVS